MEWFTAPGSDVARLLVQRGVGAVYVLAFVNVLVEWRPLLGDRGLLPVARVVARVPVRRAPSLLQWRHDDRTAMALAATGLVIALLVVTGVVAALPTWASILLWLALWGLYLSFVTVGQVFYAFGWESILLEAGFLAAFLGADDVAPPALTLWLLRWLVFRIEFGAGLIKLRGDRCWRDLTCLQYHHETQPLPGPFSWWFHHLPRWMHRVETGANHVVQLAVPWLLFAPQPVAGAAAVAIVVTQSWLLVSGNFAWLNALTVVVACAALPDAWFGDPAGPTAAPTWFVVVVAAVTLVVVVLSWWPVRNMASRRQRMNATYNPLHLVNSYGAFGSVTRTRDEVVVEGTQDDDPATATWQAYEFHAKPGAVDRRPPQVAPFHRRLDWLLWFAALTPTPERHPWLLVLLDRLLAGDPLVRRLVRVDPFAGRAPRWVRVVRYRYRYTTPAERRATGDWWARERRGVDVVPRSGGRVG
jgi:hypothetical protein